jgi:hypothetical protein
MQPANRTTRGTVIGWSHAVADRDGWRRGGYGSKTAAEREN